MATAATHCEARGEQWTPSRRQTYELLLQAGGAVKAYDLISTYAQAGERLAKPPTIYRALDFLLAAGLVHRIESINAFLARRADNANHAAGFLICDCCGRIEVLDLSADQMVSEAATARGFAVRRLVLEAHGTCADCRD